MSVSTLLRAVLRAGLCLSLLCGLALPGLAQATVLTFTQTGSEQAVVQDGQLGSADIPGLTLQIMNVTSTTSGAVGTLGVKDSNFFGVNLVSLTHQDSVGYYGMAIKSPNGRAFALRSLEYYNWGETEDTTINFIGFRNGVQVSGATQTLLWPGNSITPFTVAFPAAFDQVDDVRIVLGGGGANGTTSWHSINHLDVEFTNNPPTGINLSNTVLAQSGGSNATVGTLTSTDSDIGDSFTYTLVSGTGSDDNASFNISGGVLRANNAAALPARNYSVRVRTTDDGGGTFERSFTLTVIDNVAPKVVSITPNPSAASTDTSVTFTVTFDEAVTNVSTDDFTLVGTGSATGSIASVAGSGTTYVATVASITGNGTLKLNLNGSSNVSDAAGNTAPSFTTGGSHTVAIPTAPGAPTIGTPTAGDTDAFVAFTAPGSDGGSAITQYTATSSPGGFTASGAASPLRVTGLSNGTAYTFTVTATNSIGTGSASGASAPVTPKGAQTITFAAPGAFNFNDTPTLSASSSSGLTVSFTSSTTGVCTIASSGELTFVRAGTCTIAANQAGNAAYQAAAEVAHAFNVTAVVPGAPTIGTATAGDTQATVTFSAPATNGGDTILGYTVTASPGGNTGSGSGSPITLAGLSNGTRYTFTVTAMNSQGTGPASAASNSIEPAAPQTITFANPGAQNFGTTPTLTATSTSGRTVSFSSSTTANCTITSGGTLTFVRSDTCTIAADEAGGDGYLAAGTVTHSFTVNAVVPGAPTSVTATPSGTGEIRVQFTAPTFDGGDAITQYVATASPGGLTGSSSSSPIVVSGLNVGTSYTFTVTAANGAGMGPASTASNAATAADALEVHPVSANVPYGTATPIPLDISGVPNQLIITAQPAHGSVTVNGLTVSYQPTAGYAGADAFSYQVTDGNMTSNVAVASITVGAPSLALASTVLARGKAGTAYAQPLSVTGGTAPYTYQLLSGTLPAGITLVGDTLQGTPTTDGTFNVVVRVTDSSTGNGPFSLDQPLTLSLDAPEIEFTEQQIDDVTNGAAFTQTLRVSGGAAPYAFRVARGALPAGVTLSPAGVLSGKPEAAGSYSFDIEASDANSYTATFTFNLAVAEASQQITAFVATPQVPVYAVDGRFELAATGGPSGNAVVFASTTPAVCRVTGSSVTMLAAGRCSLTANQAGNGQYLAAPQLTLDVDISAAVPVLEWEQELHKMYGEAAFDLADPRSPSTGAFSYSSSDTTVATVQGRTVTLAGEGSTLITVTQAAAGNYAAGSAQLRLTVTNRPDPTRDPGVVAGLQAQVDASVRFASAQQANIRDRLRQVRTGSNASSNQLALNYAGGDTREGLSVPLSSVPAPRLPEGWGVWTAGNATFGKGDRRSSYDFHSDGITVGVDHALGEQLLLGVAGSMARNDSDMDGSDSRVQAKQRSLAAYGLWRVGEHLFVDGVLANGALDFDTRRWSNEMAGFGRGSRDGSQWFGSLAFGYEHRSDALTLTGYGRVEASRTTLDAYRETGLGSYDLLYRDQTVRNSALAVGLEGSFLSPDPNSRLRPFWTLEYREALDDKGQAYLNYVNAPRADDYRLDLRSYNDHALSLSAGMDIRLQRGWLLSMLFGHEQTRGSSSASTVGLRVSYGAKANAKGAEAPAR